MARHEDTFYEDYNNAKNAQEWYSQYPNAGGLYIRLKRKIVTTYESWDDEEQEYYNWKRTEIEHWSYWFTTGYRYVPDNGFMWEISKNDGFSDGLSARREISRAWATPEIYHHNQEIRSDDYTGPRDSYILEATSPCFTITYQGETIKGYDNTYETDISTSIISRETTYSVEGTDSLGVVFENKGRGWHVDQNDELVHDDLPDAYVMNDNPTSWKLDENGTLVTLLLPDAYVNRQGAFSGCVTLTDITIPDTCTSIGKWSFYGTSLTEVELPENCTYYATSFPEGCIITGGILIGGDSPTMTDIRSLERYTIGELETKTINEMEGN